MGLEDGIRRTPAWLVFQMNNSAMPGNRVVSANIAGVVNGLSWIQMCQVYGWVPAPKLMVGYAFCEPRKSASLGLWERSREERLQCSKQTRLSLGVFLSLTLVRYDELKHSMVSRLVKLLKSREVISL